jgi:hypothetical protein
VPRHCDPKRVCQLVNTLWRSINILDGGSGGGWATGTFGSAQYAEGPPLNVGETILRSRLEATIMLGMTNSSPSTTVSDPSILGATSIDMGLYCNPARAAPYAPQAATNNATDGHWLQLNEPTLHHYQVFEDSTGLYYLHGVWKLDSGTSQSFRQAGPATALSAVYVAWNFANVFTPFWAATGPPLAGKWGINLKAAVLVKL